LQKKTLKTMTPNNLRIWGSRARKIKDLRRLLGWLLPRKFDLGSDWEASWKIAKAGERSGPAAPMARRSVPAVLLGCEQAGTRLPKSAYRQIATE
jgi:hypothetical protein